MAVRNKVYTINLNVFVSATMMADILAKTAELNYPSMSAYIRSLIKAGLKTNKMFEE